MTHAQTLGATPSTAAVEQLLLQYPNVDAGELDRLIRGYRELSALDAALMTCDHRLSGKMELLRRDHGSSLSNPWTGLILLLFAPTAISAGIIFYLFA